MPIVIANKPGYSIMSDELPFLRHCCAGFRNYYIWQIKPFRDGVSENEVDHWVLQHWLHRSIILVWPKRPRNHWDNAFWWDFPKKAGRDPKREKTRVWSSFRALPPMLQGWQIWEPFESEYFLNYGEFSGISSNISWIWLFSDCHDYSGLLGTDIRWSANLRTGRAHFRDKIKHHGNRRTMERLIKPYFSHL